MDRVEQQHRFAGKLARVSDPRDELVGTEHTEQCIEPIASPGTTKSMSAVNRQTPRAITAMPPITSRHARPTPSAVVSAARPPRSDAQRVATPLHDVGYASSARARGGRRLPGSDRWSATSPSVRHIERGQRLGDGLGGIRAGLDPQLELSLRDHAIAADSSA